MKHEQAGFTLIEMMLVLGFLAPLLAVVANTSRLITGSIHTNEVRADVTDHLRRSLSRIGQFLRPGRLTSFRVAASQADVDAGRATAIGDWIEPIDFEPRGGLWFVAAEGLLSLNAAQSTPPRRITFEPDPLDPVNGLDDDGDGLTDEGDVVAVVGSTRATLARSFEVCSFTFDGQFIRVTLGGGRLDADGRVHRAVVEQSFQPRNH